VGCIHWDFRGSIPLLALQHSIPSPWLHHSLFPTRLNAGFSSEVLDFHQPDSMNFALANVLSISEVDGALAEQIWTKRSEVMIHSIR